MDALTEVCNHTVSCTHSTKKVEKFTSRLFCWCLTAGDMGFQKKKCCYQEFRKTFSYFFSLKFWPELMNSIKNKNQSQLSPSLNIYFFSLQFAFNFFFPKVTVLIPLPGFGSMISEMLWWNFLLSLKQEYWNALKVHVLMRTAWLIHSLCKLGSVSGRKSAAFKKMSQELRLWTWGFVHWRHKYTLPCVMQSWDSLSALSDFGPCSLWNL